MTGSLTVQVPTGANPTTASADAGLPTSSLPASDGTDDCNTGFDATAGQFTAPVTAPDTAYVERTGTAANTYTLTSQSAVAPFVGTGNVTIAYTPQSDSQLAVPPEWDAVSVAVGSLQVEVTDTCHTGAGTRDRRTGGLSGTGATIDRLLVAAAAPLLVGGGAVFITRRRRSNRAL
jgi:LPXTG-motif cell wall-anchored protein